MGLEFPQRVYSCHPSAATTPGVLSIALDPVQRAVGSNRLGDLRASVFLFWFSPVLEPFLQEPQSSSELGDSCLPPGQSPA